MVKLFLDGLDRVLLSRSIPLRHRFAQRLSPWLIRYIGKERFQEVMRYVGQKSPFYRERFRKFNIDPNLVSDPAQLGALFTTAEDLRHFPPEEFLCDRPEMAFETTGTTAKSKRVYFSNKEVEEQSLDGAVGFYALGLRPEDRVVSAFDYSFWNAPVTFSAIIARMRCFHVIAAKIPPDEFYDRVLDYRFNVIAGQPSWILCLTEIAEKKGTWPMKFIFTGGENMSEQTRQYIESVWNTNVYMSYGQTEAFGSIGTECKAKNGYHMNDVNLIPEIINPDKEGYGELVYTTITRKVMPFIRYRSADITKIIDEPCGCEFGPLRRLARIRGRCDEMVNCGMGNISPWFIEEILRGIPGLADDWQVAIKRPTNRDLAEFRLELQEGADQELVTRCLKENIERRQPECWRDFNLRLFDMSFHYYPRGVLRGARKLRRVVDERWNLLS
ncbi:MAG: phenylacetate--CoA ligase family protein [Acidobacteria bacterium]|nr:phenylacetate--CoA ligase family protein [Acidobacteriota bacterium]MBI3656354.1 phenylacetate--CoA ligase family protein [Acidobacteriota bacterium]